MKCLFLVLYTIIPASILVSTVAICVTFGKSLKEKKKVRKYLYGRVLAQRKKAEMGENG